MLISFRALFCRPFKETAPATTSKPAASTAFKVGDVVDFTGSTHYASSTGTRGTAAKPGKAKITLIAEGTAHPYHVVHIDSKSDVYGWVDAANISSGKKAIEEIALEVIAGKWGNGIERKNRLKAAGYNYSEVQKKVNELI